MVTKRATPGAKAWRKVERVIGDIRISRKLKGKMLSSCATRVYMNTLEKMALIEKHQQKVQVCEKKQPYKNNRGS